MAAARTSSFAPWLLLAVIALIAYGSLYPFNFEPEAVRGGLFEAMRELTWARAGKADRIYNVVLYIPLGFCAYLWFAARLGFLRTLVVALAIGSALSLSIEIAQAYLSPRVPSLKDLALNVCGTFVGAIAGSSWNALTRLLPVPSRSEAPVRETSALIIVLLWVAWRLAPFIPRVDLGSLKDALSPLFAPELQWTGIAAYLCYWLIVSHALFSLVRRHVQVEALLILIALVLAGRLLFGHEGFVTAELAALLLVLPGVVMLDRMKAELTHALLLVGLVSILTVERLFPFNFVTDMSAFDLRSPLAWASNGFPVHTPMLLQKMFVFASLWWLLHVLDASNRLANILVVSCVLALEVLQLWLPGRTGALSDPLLAACVVLLLTLVSSSGRSREAGAARHRIRA